MALSDRYELQHPDNPVVFLDIKIGDQEPERVTIELFKHQTPKTAENFRQLCTGEHRPAKRPVGYKDTVFHRVIKGFMLQGGDFVSGDGSGCASIYGGAFADENFAAAHTAPGLLSMANSGRDSNGCQFFVTCDRAAWLDGKHVVFGRVVGGMLAVRRVENVPVGAGNRPKIECKVVQCGEM